VNIYKKYSLFLLGILFLSITTGCNKNNYKNHKTMAGSQPSFLVLKHQDLPLPFDYHLIENNSKENTENLVYEIRNNSLETLSSFYEIKMEEAGWQQTTVLKSSQENLFIYKKPFRFCSISIRKNNTKANSRKEKLSVHIFMQNKQQNLVASSDEALHLNTKKVI